MSTSGDTTAPATAAAGDVLNNTPPDDVVVRRVANSALGGTSCILTSSENTNNENREKELALNSSAEEDSLPNAVEQTPPSALESSESTPPTPAQEDYSQHLTYNQHGVAIYTDPATLVQYEFDNEKNVWVVVTEANRIASGPSAPLGEAAAADPYENEHYRWCHETSKWLPKAAAITENEFYTFDAERNEWIPKASSHSVRSETGEDGETLHTYTDQDGVVFFWDKVKNAWFPKIDDDFMAQYQMGYGNYVAPDDEVEEEAKKVFTDETKECAADVGGTERAGGKRKGQPQQPQWFDMAEEKNTKVYVTGLPTDITEEEFVEMMSKYGMIFRDPNTNKMKVKLYSDRQSGQLKGDALCDYIRVESVEMALKLLDGSDVRGHKVRVERAKFEMRGEYNPSLKPKKKKQDKDKIKKMQEKLFDWRPEKMRGERSKHERTVIIKNLFEPELFEKEVHLIIDYQTDLREECSKCGTVRKVVVYDRHPEGVAQVTMADPEEADVVIQMMHKRFFGQRQLEASAWDGKTKYKIEETAAEKTKRLSNWDNFLVSEETKKLAENDEDDDSPPSGKTPEADIPAQKLVSGDEQFNVLQ